MKFNKLVSLSLTLCMVLVLLPTTALAARWDGYIAHPVAGGNIYFDAEWGRIVGCDENITEAIIPHEIRGIPVTSIHEYAFADRNNLTSVTIPDSVTFIDRFSFMNCSSLVNVTIPNSISSIEQGTFADCYSLTNVTIPTNVTSIGVEAFVGCYNLKSITIPDSIVTIYVFAFKACISLTDVYYSGTESQWRQITIDSTQDGNTPLLNATVHYNSASSDSNVGPSTGGINVGNKGIIYPVIGGNIYFDAVGGAIIDCDKSVTEAIIPHEINGVPVTIIAGEAFLDCSNLTSVTIPNGVITIGNRAFDGCSNLTSVTIPKSVTTMGFRAFNSCSSLTSATILGNITSIEEFSFCKCSRLSSVTIPSSVTTVEQGAFFMVDDLKDVYYSGSESQWRQITIWPSEGSPYSPLFDATIHYNSVAPELPAQSTRTQATPTNDSLTADGVIQIPTVYKINGSNYFKIRDLAAILSGTEKQFAVGYDSALKSVTVTTGQGYDKQSGDLAGAPAGGDKTAEPSNDAIYINGRKVEAEVYKIDGSNYFKLRDLGKALNFYVGWSAERGMYIETDKPYSE